MESRGHIARNGVLCSLLFLTALVLAKPFAEMGFIDDWSYIKTAQIFAQTGHIQYNGWATASLGWEIPWGALFARLFGSTFTAVRLSTFPVAALTIYLFHSSLRRLGATSRNGITGTLALAFSPLLFPLAATCMTDVPGLFCIVLCGYLCLRAAESSSARSCLGWLALASVSNVVGGTVRQIVWLGALVMVPSTAYLLRKRYRLLPAAALLFLCSLGCILFCLRWLGAQPYALPERIFQGTPTPHMLAHMGAELLKSVLCLALLCYPLLCACFVFGRKLNRGALLRIAVVLCLLLVAAVPLAQQGSLGDRVMPWLGHILGTQSIFTSTGEMLGTRPATISLPLRTLLSLLVIAALLFFLELLPSLRRQGISKGTRTALWITGPFSIAYMGLLLPRGLYSFIYDRYLLGILPWALVLLILFFQGRTARSLPQLCNIVILVFAGYTFAATHDWFALNRARVTAFTHVRQTGVPQTAIQGGFDLDGWTQLEAAGHINDARIQHPAGAYNPSFRLHLPAPCVLNFSTFTPAIHPSYFLVFHPMPCLSSAPFDPVMYRTWLPPFRRFVYIQQLPAASGTSPEVTHE